MSSDVILQTNSVEDEILNLSLKQVFVLIKSKKRVLLKTLKLFDVRILQLST